MLVEKTAETPIIRFVLAGLVVKFLVMLIGGIYSFYTEKELGNIATPVNILAMGVGLGWYAKSINMPMMRKQIFLFAAGTCIADLFISLLWLVVVIWLSNQPFSIAGIDAAIFDSSGIIFNRGDQFAILFLMIFSLLMTFVLAAFFAWLITRKLPR